MRSGSSLAYSGLYRRVYRALLRAWLPFRLIGHERIHVEYLKNVPIILLPGVFNGIQARTGAFLAKTLTPELVPPGARVLDLGTGSGLCAIFAAGYGAQVVATDINPEAVRCAHLNALAHHLENRIETKTGDLFSPIGDSRFDLVLFNPPFYRGQPRDMADHAWRSVDAFDRFLRELPKHLSPKGRALVVLSTDGDLSRSLWASRDLFARVVRQQEFINEKLTVYELSVFKERE